MPYIAEARCRELGWAVPETARLLSRSAQKPGSPAPAGLGVLETSGELNWAITQLLEDYRAEHGDSYGTFNDILGAALGARDEFYRRVVVPYEDQKCKDNGDVYAEPRSTVN